MQTDPPPDLPQEGPSGSERLTSGLTRKERLLLGSIVALALGLVVALVAVFWQPAPPSRVVMSTGAPDGAYHAYALRYREILARSGVELVLRPSAGSVENLQRLRKRDGGVTLALVQGGLAEPADAERLVSLGAVAYEPLWVFHRATLKLQGFEDLRGRRIAGGGPGSGTRMVVDRLLELHGIAPGAGQPPVVPQTGLAAAQALERGEVDVTVLVAAPEAPAVQRLLRADGVSLWSWRRAEAYARQIPVLTRVQVPEGAVDLRRNLPPQDVNLLSLKASLVAAADVHPVLVDLLLDAAREVHGGSGLLRRAGEFPAPESSEYRMSADAERFHKSGPSVLRRYLPYPAVVWIQRLIYFGLPLLVVGLPLTRVLPIVYRWGVRRRIYRWYGELSFIERAASAQPRLRPQHLQRLAEIEARVNRLRIPASYAWEAYTLRMHVQMVRERLRDV
jgi:hypothetical protein